MKTTTQIQTTITVELSAQDVLAYVQDKKLVPESWQFYSVEVKGTGVSKGAELIIKSHQTKP